MSNIFVHLLCDHLDSALVGFLDSLFILKFVFALLLLIICDFIMNIWRVCFCKYVIFLELQFFVSVSVWVSCWFRSCWLLSVFLSDVLFFYKNTHIRFSFHCHLEKCMMCLFFFLLLFFFHFMNYHCVFFQQKTRLSQVQKNATFCQIISLLIHFILFYLHFTRAI